MPCTPPPSTRPRRPPAARGRLRPHRRASGWARFGVTRVAGATLVSCGLVPARVIADLATTGDSGPAPRTPRPAPRAVVAAAITPAATPPPVASTSAPAAAPPHAPRASAAPHTAAPTHASTPSAPPHHVLWGAYVPGFAADHGALDAVERIAGRHLDIVMGYQHWGGPWSAFNASDVRAIIDHGSTPMITWISDDPSAPGYPDPSTQRAYTASAIVSGRHDDYIRSWAAGLRSIGAPVLIRLDHEMNGNWGSYSPGVNGQTSPDFVALWRHVHDVVTGAGATNVRWVWSPNVAYQGSTPLSGLYPGDAYVDEVGVDGYNWGPTTQYHSWQSFTSVFDDTLAQVHAITSRPLMVTEVASTEVGGDKAAWIADFFATLSRRGDIGGFIWFDVNKETDWRINSSAAALRSFAAGLRTVN